MIFNIYTHTDCYPLQADCKNEAEAIALGIEYQQGEREDKRITSFPYFLCATRKELPVVTAALCGRKAIRNY